MNSQDGFKKIGKTKSIQILFIAATVIAFGFIFSFDMKGAYAQDMNPAASTDAVKNEVVSAELQQANIAVTQSDKDMQAKKDAKVEKQKKIEREDKALISFMRKMNGNLSKEKAAKYVSYINKASKKYKVDRYWIAAMMWKESTFQNLNSGSGSLGLMQMLGSTGRLFGLSKSDLMNPEKNVDACVHYLSKLTRSFGNDIKLGTLAYNQGSSSVRRGVKTSYYVRNVSEKYSTIKKYVNNF